MSGHKYDFSSKTFHETILGYYKGIATCKDPQSLGVLLNRIANDCTMYKPQSGIFTWLNQVETSQYVLVFNKDTLTCSLSYTNNSGAVILSNTLNQSGTAFNIVSGFSTYSDTITTLKQAEDLKTFLHTKIPQSKLVMVSKLALNTLIK